MFTAGGSNGMRDGAGIAQANPGKAVCILRMALGLAALTGLPGCATDPGPVADLPTGVSATAGPAPDGKPAAFETAPGGPAETQAAAMTAKARALVIGAAKADSGASRPEPAVDLAMLAMRSNPGATYRIEGPAAPGAKPDLLPPDQVMERLRELSHAPRAEASGGEGDGRAEAVLARLRELSHRAQPADEAARTAASSAPASRGPSRPVSPESIMRRMQELAGAKREAEKPEAGDATPGAEAFGGLAAFAPAPAMARTPAVDRVVAGWGEGGR